MHVLSMLSTSHCFCKSRVFFTNPKFLACFSSFQQLSFKHSVYYCLSPRISPKTTAQLPVFPLISTSGIAVDLNHQLWTSSVPSSELPLSTPLPESATELRPIKKHHPVVKRWVFWCCNSDSPRSVQKPL